MIISGQIEFKRCGILFLLTVLLIFLSVQTNAFASSTGTCGINGDNLTWTLNNSGVLTIQGTGEMKNMLGSEMPWGKNVKQVIISEGVTSIGSYAFYECNKLLSVSIPSTVRSIGMLAFNKCSSLTNVLISEGLQTIDNAAFSSCESLWSIHLPESLTTISRGCFSGCKKLESINIPHQIKILSENLFMNNTNLKYLVLPDGVTTIEKWAFYGCTQLHVQIPNSVTDIGEKILDSIFASSAVIYCNEYSIIESYARENNYQVILLDNNESPIELTPVFIANDYELEVGKTTKWSFTIFPEGQDSPTLEDFSFISSDNLIATIGTDGLIRGKKQGTVTFFAHNGDLTYTMEIRIIKKCTSFTLTVDELGAVIGDKIQLKARTIPDGADIKWQACLCYTNGEEMNSSLTINPTTGLVQLPSKLLGDMNLRVTDSYTGYSIIVPLYVMDPPYLFAFEESEYVVRLGSTIQTICQLKKYQWNGEIYNNRFVEFSSSDPSVASVDPYSGLVTANTYGRVIITATMGTKKTTTSVLVLKPASSIQFNNNPLYVEAKWHRNSNCYVIPNGADTNFTWSTENSLIATVEDGIIYGHALGQTKINVTEEYTGIKGDLTVIVRYPVDTVQLSAEDITIPVGETNIIIAHAFARGTEYTDQVFTYESSNDSVVTVDDSGNICAIGAGEANITVKSENGTEAVCIVTVPTILVSNETIEMDLYTSQYVMIRDIYSDLDLAWTTSDTTNIGVSPSGKLSANAEGTATITVCIEKTDYQESFTVFVSDPFIVTQPIEVEEPVQSISINNQPQSITKGQSVELLAAVYPENATITIVNWRSLDESIASVDENGFVVALAPGRARIVAIAMDGTMVHTTCEFIVRGNGSITLPAGIKQVGADAFAYTNADEYYVPFGMISVGSRAFANLKNIALVHLPKSITMIADNAFSGSRITICCETDSYTAAWAELHGIDFIIE